MNEVVWLERYAAKGDAEAFAQLVSRYQDMVFATCRRKLHDAAEVDDAVQEVFLRLARKAGELRNNIGGWLHRCAVNVATDFNRRREARARREAAVAKPERTAGVTESQELLSELRANLDEAMAQLDAASRELLIQRYFVGRSQVELAHEAGVTPSTISNRLASAVEKLRSCLKHSGKGMGIGAVVLVAALEAEKACACVPAGLSASVMKFGLRGVGTAGGAAGGGVMRAAVSPIRRQAARIGLGAVVAAMLLVMLGLAARWIAGRDTVRMPVEVTAAVEPPRESWNDQPVPAALPRNEAAVMTEVRVWTAEGMLVTDARVKLLDRAGKELAQAGEAANKFSVSPGPYWVVVQPTIGEPQARMVQVGNGKDGVTAVDVLLR
jgi:RNA polymerase sigma factor (sigma-70 family)